MRTTKKQPKQVKPKLVMHPVKSSNIKEIGYMNKDMYVAYIKGDTYLFKDTPKDQYEKILNAESIGKALYAAKLIGIKIKLD